MKKQTILPLLMAASFICTSVNAQVGINTPSPQATFDITAKNPKGTSTNVDGLLVPRVDRERAQKMTGVPTSTLIYVDSISTGTKAGTAINIDSEGYYYFNGVVWTKLTPPQNNNTALNIYNSDGTLTGNRTVTQGVHTLTFNTNQKNGFSVDGNTFSIDAANDRVGIGTTTPYAKLDVKGNMRLGVANVTNASPDVSTVVRDNYTGELKTVTSSTGNTAIINFVSFILKNVNRDWIEDFDTKISTYNYTMAIVGSSFTNPNTNALGAFLKPDSTSQVPIGVFSPKNVFAFEKNGTWHIKADYFGSITNAGNGDWMIDCLVINKSVVKSTPIVIQDLGGSKTGSAVAAPAGL